jgi:hypothetical protein
MGAGGTTVLLRGQFVDKRGYAVTLRPRSPFKQGHWMVIL